MYMEIHFFRCIHEDINLHRHPWSIHHVQYLHRTILATSHMALLYDNHQPYNSRQIKPTVKPTIQPKPRL